MALGRTNAHAVRRLALLAVLPLTLVLAAVPAGAVPHVSAAGATTALTPRTAPTQRLQGKVEAARAAYELAGEKVAALSAQSDRLTADTRRTEALAADLRAKVADQQGGFFHALGGLVSTGDSDVDRAAEAAADAEAARRLSDMVAPVLADAIGRAERARIRWETAQSHQERVEATWGARQVAAAAIRRAEPPPAYDVSDPAQDLRNHRALAGWQHYLRQVGSAAVVPPPARTLDRPHHLAAPLTIVRDAGLRAVPGVAQVQRRDGGRLTVLSAETVRAVSAAFGTLGVAEVGDDPLAATCGGFVATAWSSADGTFPADAAGQWQELRAVRPQAWQTGDLVLFGHRRSGIDATGVYVGGGRAIVTDPVTGTPAVRVVRTTDVLGVRRPTLAAEHGGTAPAGGACGAPEPVPVVVGSGPLQLPIPEGGYHLSAGFGSAGGLWSSGAHTGQDFAAPVGSTVRASGSGVVTIEHPSWAGNLVRIDHGGGVETWYAHLSRVDVTAGQSVETGQVIGAVGNLGNSTGPHLHLEVRLDGIAVDPLQVLDVPEAPRPTYPNGDVPASALCAATSDGAQLLRCDAAVSFRLMGAAYASDLGAALCITDSYRSRAIQEQTFVTKPNLAATPGTSVHGWGLAADLCGGIESFDTAEHAWLVAHGPAFGWVHPSWAEAGGGRPEPWHFEYAG